MTLGTGEAGNRFHSLVAVILFNETTHSISLSKRFSFNVIITQRTKCYTYIVLQMINRLYYITIRVPNLRIEHRWSTYTN